MSLINQMLRDLENRHRNCGDRPVAEAEPQPVRQSAERSLGMFLFAGLVLIGMVCYGLGLFPVARQTASPPFGTIENTAALPSKPSETQHSFAAASLLAAAAVNPVAPDVKESAAKTVVAETTLPQPADPIVAAETEPPISTMQSRNVSAGMVTNLLDLGILEAPDSARLALEFGQFPKYRVLQDGGNGNPVRLILLGTALGASVAIPQLKGMLLDSVSLVPEQEGLLLTIELKDAVRLQELQLPTDAYHGDRLLLDLEKLSQRAKPTLTAGPVVTVTIPKPSIAPAPQYKKTSKTEPQLTREEQAMQSYRDGLEQLAQHDQTAAENSFSKALRLQPQLLEARRQLSALLLQMQRTGDAEKLLQTGLQLHPANPELRKTYARLLLGEKQLGKAIAILNTAPLPDVAGDLEYHALLAALLQEAGDYIAAAKRYEQLLAVQPHEALWWLGLAIAQEQSGSLDSARRSYRQALDIPGLRPDLAAYARDRLQVL
jgi:Tfp pilus assembly protein PilF